MEKRLIQNDSICWYSQVLDWFSLIVLTFLIVQIDSLCISGLSDILLHNH